MLVAQQECNWSYGHKNNGIWIVKNDTLLLSAFWREKPSDLLKVRHNAIKPLAFDGFLFYEKFLWLKNGSYTMHFLFFNRIDYNTDDCKCDRSAVFTAQFAKAEHLKKELEKVLSEC